MQPQIDNNETVQMSIRQNKTKDIKNQTKKKEEKKKSNKLSSQSNQSNIVVNFQLEKRAPTLQNHTRYN